MCRVLLPYANCQENTSFTALIITTAVMFPFSIMNLQELLLHYLITMQIMATIRCVCLLCLSLLAVLVHVVFWVTHLNEFTAQQTVLEAH